MSRILLYKRYVSVTCEPYTAEEDMGFQRLCQGEGALQFGGVLDDSGDVLWVFSV